MNEPKSSQSEPQTSLGRRPVLALITSHWLAMFGLGLVLTAIVLWSCLLSVKLRHGEDNPYIGLAMTVVAGVLVAGMLLTPLGLFLGRRKLKERVAGSILEGKTAWVRLLAFFLVVSCFNLAIVSQAGGTVVHRLESKQFCASCHVMTPESRAFDQGAHAALMCVDCHVGNGARGFVESKVSGSRQLYSVLSDTVEKPIQGGIESGKLVPTVETCEECHWKEKAASATLKMFRRYDEDEANTPKTTLMTMNVGGGRMGGIHGAHHGEGISLSFVATDPKRQDIPLIEYKNSKTGTSRTYVKAGASASTFDGQPRIAMQCFDCHNRAAHSFQMPDRAIDRALMLGRMSSSLPFLKKTAMEILKTEYSGSDQAALEIPKTLSSYYQKTYPELSTTRAADIQEAGTVLADVYSRNVFPELGVTWGTYPDNRGHETAPGCFRCHDGEHVAASGEKITKDCFHCHFPSAVNETQPEVLELLGVDQVLHELNKK